MHHGNDFCPFSLLFKVIFSFHQIKLPRSHLVIKRRRSILAKERMNRIKTFFTYRYLIYPFVGFIWRASFSWLKTSPLSRRISRRFRRIQFANESRDQHLVCVNCQGEPLAHRASRSEERETDRWGTTVDESIFIQCENDCSTSGNFSSRSLCPYHQLYFHLECLHKWYSSRCWITSMLIVLR